MRDRNKSIDLALAFAAAFVITLAFWPMSKPRQIIRCHFHESGWETYSLALDDPNLDALKEKVKQWSTPEMYPEYVTAKWQKEVAEFYENSQPIQPPTSGSGTRSASRKQSGPATATISDTVTTASFDADWDHGNEHHSVSQVGYEEPVSASDVEQSVHDAVDQSLSDREQRETDESNYWSSVRATAIESMNKIEAKTQNAPVVLEGVTRPTWPQLAYHVAFLLGVLSACGYMHWLRLAPVDSEVPFGHQPIQVLARVGTFGGMIVFAFISAVVVWI